MIKIPEHVHFSSYLLENVDLKTEMFSQEQGPFSQTVLCVQGNARPTSHRSAHMQEARITGAMGALTLRF